MDLFRSAIYRLACDAQSMNIAIYGCDEMAKRIFDKLSLLDIKIVCFVENIKCENVYCGLPVRRIEEIVDDNELRIIVTNDVQAKELEKYGLKRGENYKTIMCNNAIRQEYRFDPNVGYNLVTDEKLPGFKCFGNENAKETIVVLGNSTSDPNLYSFKCWSEILSEILQEHNKNNRVLCGAVSGHMSPQELLKLIRDVLPLKPKMIICYEGFQDISNTFRDTSYPFIIKYQKEFLKTINIDKMIDIYYTKGYTLGIDSRYTPYELWKNSMRMMHAICQEFQIDFKAILQPSIFNKMHCLGKKDWEVVLHYELRDDLLKWFQQFFIEYKEDCFKLNYCYDYTNIFDTIDGIYMDNCHVYEPGNEIIAQKIYNDFFRENE